MGASSDNLIPEDLFESGFWDDVVAKTGQVADRVRRLATVKVAAPESVDVASGSPRGRRGRPKSPCDMSLDELRGLIEKHGSPGSLARAAMICPSTLHRCLTGERSLTAATARKLRAATLRLVKATTAPAHPVVVATPPVRQSPRYTSAHAKPTMDQLFAALVVIAEDRVAYCDSLVSWNTAAADIIGWILTGTALYRYVEELGEKSSALAPVVTEPRVTEPRVARPCVVKECHGCGKTGPHNTYIEARGGGVVRVMGRCASCCRERRRKAKKLQSESA